jgi:hypothetical protein
MFSNFKIFTLAACSAHGWIDFCRYMAFSRDEHNHSTVTQKYLEFLVILVDLAVLVTRSLTCAFFFLKNTARLHGTCPYCD